MAYTFKPEKIFTKGVVSSEFFDVSSNDLLGYTEYVTDFSLEGSMNDGAVEAGPGNMLVMMIPDTARLNITAKSADSALNNMALTVGATLSGNGVVETVTGITAVQSELSLAGAVAPLGGNDVVCYILTSSGTDKAAVEAASGEAHEVVNGIIQGFTATAGNTYCVKYFAQNSSATQLTIPALFAPKVVRAHFAVNCYAKSTGKDVMSSSLYKIRHYYFPYYYFTGAMADTIGQTETGSVDLSGTCLSYEEALGTACTSTGNQSYGFIVDEYVGSNTSTNSVEGIYFIGLGSGVSVATGASAVLPVKYVVAGALTDISDMSQVTFATAAAATAKFADEHANTLSGVAAGTTAATVSVTNARTGVTYTDTIPVTVT